MLGARKNDTPVLPPTLPGTPTDRGQGFAGFGAPFQSSSATDWAKESIHSIVDKHLTMRGDLESDGDILVRGKVIGNIKCKLLIIDHEAQVDGGVEAEEVLIRGKAKGKVQANRVRLEKSAMVDAEILHRSFSAEEGAKIKGSLRFMEEGETKDSLALVA